MYEYNEGLKAPELKCITAELTETAQNLYDQFTMIGVGEYGVIFKA